MIAFLLAASQRTSTAGDLSQVVLFDGERQEMLNTWGGALAAANVLKADLQEGVAFSGRRALRLDLRPLAPGESFYIQCFASGFGPTPAYCQTRNLARFERLGFWLRNQSGAAMHGTLQVKDYRDALEHASFYRFELPASESWTHIDVPLDAALPAWRNAGAPDWTRVLSLDLVFEATERLPPGGKLLLDDMLLTERGGPMDIEHTPLNDLVARLAARQWHALWDTRSREHGFVPNTSYQSTDGALNATSALVWTLPAAVRHGWVTQDEADAYMTLLAKTLNRLLDKGQYLPPRNVDWVTLQPSLLPEESSVDAAFMAMALHQYKSDPATRPELRDAIDRTQNRFNFKAFATASGWEMAYRFATPWYPAGFTHWVYNGYTNESSVVSLAAHLATTNHVPIDAHWNTSQFRARAAVRQSAAAPVVHSWVDFRAPFAQALLNLFVDVRDRGTDRYPDAALAANPWENFVRYHHGVMQRLSELGRPYLVQPDAGDDGSLNNYRQYSLYNDFGEGDLFMPWSAAFPLMAGVENSEEALRFLLLHGLHGPLGMADAAKWVTGAPAPYFVTARQDYWNTGLATMALLEWLDGDQRASRSFAMLPEVRGALDTVFDAPPPQPPRGLAAIDAPKEPPRELTRSDATFPKAPPIATQ